MADLYSTDAMLGVLEDLTVPKSALLDAFFNTIQTEDSEEIHFDQADGARKLAPFVSPVVEGKIVQERGFTTRTFKPAYVKPKTPIDPNRPLKRAMGEQIGGTQLSPQQREQIIVAMELENHVQMIRNRLEWMAAQVLATGAVTVSGDGYQTVSVDFGRTNTHTVTLTSNDLWSASHADSKPLEDLQNWATIIVKDSGAGVRNVIMEPDAWNAFRSHSTLAGRLDYRNVTDTSIQLGAANDRGLVFRGQVDGFNIWVYQDWYEAANGTVTPFLASGTVLMVSDALEGVQAFGAIRDPEAGYMAMPYFPKSWVEKDPGQRVIMTQSAPLVVPFRPDASLAATVL